MSGWRIDERAHAGAEHLDPAHVADYERKAGFDPAEDLEVLRRHGLHPGSVVLDMGAGTGVFTAAVAPAVPEGDRRRRVPGDDRGPARPRRGGRAGQRHRGRGRRPLLRARRRRRGRGLLESLLERVGFRIVDRAYRRSAYGAYTCIRPPTSPAAPAAT